MVDDIPLAGSDVYRRSQGEKTQGEAKLFPTVSSWCELTCSLSQH